MLWGIWKVRNLRVFDEPTDADLPRTLSKAIKFYEDYLEAHAKASHVNSSRQMRWSPSPHDFLKINTDAGLREDGSGQVGAIARDDQGRFIHAAVKTLPEVQHPTLLEAYEILLGLELAKDCYRDQVILESDCQLLILALQTRKVNISDLDTIVEDCLEASKDFEEVRFNFVRRTANHSAHQLTKVREHITDVTHFFSVPPNTIVDSLLQDVMISD